MCYPIFKMGVKCRSLYIQDCTNRLTKIIYVLAAEHYGCRNKQTEKASFKLITEILLALNNKLTVGGKY
jgi:hypothetical protein